MVSIEPDMLEQIRVRELEVLGSAPRILPLDRQSVAEEVQAQTAALRGGVVGKDAPSFPLEAIPEIMFTLCRYPEIWGKIMAMSLQLQGPSGTLVPRVRQLAILRTAWLLQAPYEWGEHVRHSKRIGVTSEDIERVVAGSHAEGWTQEDAAVIACCDELRDGAMVSNATWEVLGETMDDAQRFELLALIGQFTKVAYIQNSLRLRLEPSNEGLTSR